MIKQITIDNILGGWSPSEYFTLKGQFNSSVGIDPEMPKTDSLTRPSGLIRPTAMTNIANNLSGAVMWLVSNNKDNFTYGYNSDGKVFILDNSYTLSYLNSGNALSGAGNGCDYYNNYIYYALNTDICRYGPLSNSPSFNTTFWTGTLSKTALTNTSYPQINGINIPNHPVLYHFPSDRLFIGDVLANGKGCLHKIHTKKGTYEGDTDDTTTPSAYDVLDLVEGMWPTCMAPYNSMIAIGVIDGANTVVRQRNAKVVLWDTQVANAPDGVNTVYNMVIPLDDPLITGLKFVNGVLYALSGSASGGMRLSQYVGGRTFQEICYLDDSFPPFQGAIDYILGKIVFGGKTSTPITSASVFGFGGKSRAMGMGVHNILNTTSIGSSPMVTAVKYISPSTIAQPVVAWKDGTYKGIDKPSTTYVNGANVFRSEIFRVSTNFDIKRIRVPIIGGMATNKAFTVNIYEDSTLLGTRSVTNTTDPNAAFIDIYPDPVWSGQNSFLLEIVNNGTALCTIGLPILIIIETKIQN